MELILMINFEKCKIDWEDFLPIRFREIVEKEFGEHFEISASLKFFRKKLFGYIGLYRNYVNKERIAKLIKVTKELCEMIKPERVVGDYDPTIDMYYSKKDYLFWLNIFNPVKVKELGKDKLLSAPVYLAEELSDGAVLLVLNEDPWNCSQEIRDKVRRHIFGK